MTDSGKSQNRASEVQILSLEMIQMGPMNERTVVRQSLMAIVVWREKKDKLAFSITDSTIDD
jgi:hypothetical protein